LFLCTTRVVAASNLLYLSEIESNRIYSGWDLSKYCLLQNLKKVAEKITQITIRSNPGANHNRSTKNRGKGGRTRSSHTTFFSKQRELSQLPVYTTFSEIATRYAVVEISTSIVFFRTSKRLQKR
jgi:hypothetical protein